jgi:hypothetical protein
VRYESAAAFRKWAPDYGRLAEEVGLEPDLGAAFKRAAAFLDPVLSGEASGNWDAAVSGWVVSGGKL